MQTDMTEAHHRLSSSLSTMNILLTMFLLKNASLKRKKWFS